MVNMKHKSFIFTILNYFFSLHYNYKKQTFQLQSVCVILLKTAICFLIFRYTERIGDLTLLFTTISNILVLIPASKSVKRGKQYLLVTKYTIKNQFDILFHIY